MADFADGTFVKARDRDEVYVVVAGELLLISAGGVSSPGEEELPPQDMILTVSDEDLQAIPKGQAIGAVVEKTQGPEEVISSMTGRWMHTRARVSQEQHRVDAYTRVWTTQWWVGFTGGVSVLMGGANREIVHSTELVQIGVDGTFIPTSPSDRTVQWMQWLPEDKAVLVDQLEIVQTHAPKSRFLDVVREGIAIAAPLLEIAAKVKALGATSP